MSVLALEEVLQLVNSIKHHHCIEVRYFVHTEKLTLYQDISTWSSSCWIELKDRLHRNTKGSVENKLDGLNEFNGVLRLGLGQSNLCHISKTLCTKPKQKLRLNITLNCSLWGQIEWNLISWQSCRHANLIQHVSTGRRYVARGQRLETSCWWIWWLQY